MSKCFNCGREFTLRPLETKCDNCGAKINFKCWRCNNWFEINPNFLCKVCGFYICPVCNICGNNCQKEEWEVIIKEIIPIISEEQLEKLVKFIEEIKIGKEQKVCTRGVPISYAKSRIKRCVVKTQGYKIRDSLDLQKFKERLNQILSINLGTVLTINKSRESGSYGQEYRDIFNYCICLGKLEVEKRKLKEGEKEIEYVVFKRCEKSTCPMLDLKKLIIKLCTNPKCTIKEFPLSQTECCYCRYIKGKKEGQFYPLKLKISNKDICQLPRSEFKKEEENGGI